MAFDTFDTGTLDVFSAITGSAIDIPKGFWKPGTASLYNAYAGKTSLLNYGQGSLNVGMSPDSPFAYTGAPGNVNFHNTSVTTYTGDHRVLGRSSVSGTEFRANVANVHLVGVNAQLVGSYTGVTGKSVSINGGDIEISGPSITCTSPSGKLVGYWTYNGVFISVGPHTSDISLKKNIKPLTNSIEKISNLNPVSFNWDEKIVPELAKNYPDMIGLIAQEVEEIVPEVVCNTDIKTADNKKKTVKRVLYENLVSLLIDGMKEQQKKINDLENRISRLESK